MFVLNTKNSTTIPEVGRKTDLSVRDVFEVGGLIDTYLKTFGAEYEKRESQIQLAEMIATSINQGKNLIAEAPCGTGKSFAYLVPAIMQTMNTEKKVVIATANIFLQEQLAEKDLPFLQGVFGCGFDYALVKGKNNYLCNMKHEEFMELPEKFLGSLRETDREMAEALADWAEMTNTGDKSEFPQEPSPATWEIFSITDDDCLNNRCPFYLDCHAQKSREKAKTANIIVCNYHILLLDLKLKATGKPGFLPAYDSIILDEAHRLEEIARSFFGQDVSEYSCRRTLAALEEIAGWKTKLNKEYKAAQKTAFLGLYEGNESPQTVKEQMVKLDSMMELCVDVAKLRKSIEKLNTDMFTGIKAYYDRNKFGYVRTKEKDIVAYQDLTNKLHDAGKALLEWCFYMVARNESPKDSERFRKRSDECQELAKKIEAIISQQEEGFVYWIEAGFNKPTKIYSKPIEVNSSLEEMLWNRYPSTVLVSGTIAVGGPLTAEERKVVADGNNGPLTQRFAFSMDHLGLPAQRTDMYICDSPFDYKSNCALVIVNDWPVPQKQEQEYREVFLTQVQKSIIDADGGALVLFTSYDHMKYFFDNCTEIQKHYNVYAQKLSMISRKNLIQKFKEDEKSVLLGAASFWEGLDVPGMALKLLVIDKLPFPNKMQDPFLDALDEIKDNAFAEDYLPRAIIRLKQGFGRLIRNKDDKGLVVLADSRCNPSGPNRKNYSGLVKSSFPNMRWANNTSVVKDYFKSIK